MTVWWNTSKTRRFKILAICLLIVVTSVLFVAHVARPPSASFISVKFVRSKFHPDTISIELSNRMSFNLEYEILGKEMHSEKSVPARGRLGLFTLGAHAYEREFITEPPEGTR